jgi:MGT family glycosyltransferase
MATLGFLFDHQEGHLLPTFKLARRLIARGHRIEYLGIPDGGDVVRRHGFAFTPILERVFPPGSTRVPQEDFEGNGRVAEEAGRRYERYLGPMARGEEIDGAIRALRPDLLVTTSFEGARALVLHYRYRLPVVLLTTWLRPGTRAEYLESLEGTLVRLRNGMDELLALARQVQPSARRLSDVTAPFLRMRELILCPEDLEIPDPTRVRERETFHVEASIDLDRGEEGMPPLDPARRLLYVSLGSQLEWLDRQAGARFLRAVLDAFIDQTGWQLVLSTRGVLNEADLPSLPPWITLSPWVPQLQILRHAAVMITHGGLGTVKECIFRGVPMVVFPMVTDQPDNARRIEHHRLGLRGDFTSMMPDEIRTLVARVDREPVFRESVGRMRRRFEEVEDAGMGARRIEEVLERRR